MKKIPFVFLISGLFYSCVGLSETFGTGSTYDSRIQTVIHNDNDVVNVRVKKGTVSVVQVSKEETIQDIGLGDPLAWNVSVRNNSVFFRPKSEDNPNTNVTIVTNKHTYPLYLISVAIDPTYVLKFHYLEPPKMTFYPEKTYPCTEGDVINGHYQLQGSHTIFPYQIWDNGEFTCMRWSGRQEMPVIYRVNSDGNENLVNHHRDKNTMVIHEVANKFVLRLGDQVVNVRTSSIVNRGWNIKATTNGQTRTEKRRDES